MTVAQLLSEISGRSTRNFHRMDRKILMSTRNFWWNSPSAECWIFPWLRMEISTRSRKSTKEDERHKEFALCVRLGSSVPHMGF
jgi:hypothetical protein